MYFSFLAHNAVVTCSVFAPNPDLILKQLNCQQNSSNSIMLDEVSILVSGDLMSKKVRGPQLTLNH